MKMNNMELTLISYNDWVKFGRENGPFLLTKSDNDTAGIWVVFLPGYPKTK